MSHSSFIRGLAPSLGLLILAQAEAAFAQPTELAKPPPDTSPRFTPSVYPRFADWQAACARLPANRALKGRLPAKELLPLKNFAEFGEALEAYFAQCKTGELSHAEAWLGEKPAKAQFFNTGAAYFMKPAIPFQPFAQRLSVPPGAQVIFHGDFHGDIQSMVAWLAWLNEHGYLQDFKLARPDAYLVLLGDYTDRGLYGVEVLYSILRLKLENPERVLLVRGNHEDVSLAARYGFLTEATGKYGRTFDVQRVMRLYDFLPAVLYLGCEESFIQCNHGGLEPGYDPGRLLDAPGAVRFQFLGELKQAQFLKEHSGWAKSLPEDARRMMERIYADFAPENPTTPSVLGFMWNDFTVARGEPEFAIDPGRALVYGEGTTRYMLDQASTPARRVHAVFRAHQHSNVLNPMMRRLKASRGVFSHWQTNDSPGLLDADPAALARSLEHREVRPVPPHSVWTFNVAPDSAYGEGCDFNFDTFGILTTAMAVADWRLRVVNLKVVK